MALTMDETRIFAGNDEVTKFDECCGGDRNMKLEHLNVSDGGLFILT